MWCGMWRGRLAVSCLPIYRYIRSYGTSREVVEVVRGSISSRSREVK